MYSSRPIWAALARSLTGLVKLAASAGACHCCLILPFSITTAGVGRGLKGSGVGVGILAGLSCIGKSPMRRSFESGGKVGGGFFVALGLTASTEALAVDSVVVPAGLGAVVALACGVAVATALAGVAAGLLVFETTLEFLQAKSWEARSSAPKHNVRRGQRCVCDSPSWVCIVTL